MNIRKITNFISAITGKSVQVLEGNRKDDADIPSIYDGVPVALGSRFTNVDTGITEYTTEGDMNYRVVYNFVDAETKKDVHLLEINWLSSETKPTELGDKPVAIGSILLEADTGLWYVYAGEGAYTPLPTGGSTDIGMFIGNVNQTTSAFPTTRPGGAELINGDYVKVAKDAVLPFTIGTITFTSKKDRGVYLGGNWVLDSEAVVEIVKVDNETGTLTDDQ